MDERKEIVARGYDAVADRYEALERPEAPWPRARWLAELLAQVPLGGVVLDVGCGNGVPGLQLIARQHRPVGIDISAEQVRRARERVPQAEVLHGDVMEARFVPESLDAIVSFYTLEHLPLGEHAAFFERCRRWLRPGGHLLVATEPTVGEGEGVWLGVPMYMSGHDLETTLGLIRDAGFEILRHAVEEQLEGGTPVTYVWVVARSLAAAGGVNDASSEAG